MTHLPLLDLTPLRAGDVAARAELVARVDECLITDGFLVIVGHGVPDTTRLPAREAALRFFHQTDAAKRSVHVDDRRGWVPSGFEATGYASGAESLPDLKESFTVGHEPDGDGRYRPNRWDTGVDGFREAIVRYFEEMLRLGADLMRLFATALGVEEHHLTRLSQHPDSELNLNWYPPLGHLDAPRPGQFRIGPHCDYGCFAILDRQAGARGLQIRTREGEWIDVPAHPGSYTVNVGDLLARMTSERWRSTLHRVLPPSPDAPDEGLLSLVYFHEFDADAVIETLPPPAGGGVMFPPVVADDYIAGKYAAVTL